MSHSRPSRREAGFTIVELLVATTLTALFIVIILNMLEASARTTNVQTDLAELQQAQRIAQHDLTRMFQMAGRGGVPIGPLPTGMAVEVLDNAGANAHINPGDDDTPEVLDGTDTVILRGVFEGPIFQLLTDAVGNENPEPNLVFDTGDPTTATAGTITISNPSPSGIPQSIDPLVEAIEAGRNEALILISPLSDQLYTVVELDAANSTFTRSPDVVNLAFFISGGTYSDAYAAKFNSTPILPSNFLSAAHLGVLEEYRYYIQEQRAGEELYTSLSRARVYPGTQIAYAGNAANWAVDIVDNALDLQAAIGVDLDGDGRTNDAKLTDLGTPDEDEWLFNHGDDDAADPAWNLGDLSYLRISTILRSARRDYKNLDPLLNDLENHDYTTASPVNTDEQRQYYRRILTTTVDLRNL